MKVSAGDDAPRGRIVRITGPTVMAEGLSSSAMNNMVRVGAHNLIGEVIRIEDRTATVQVYEDTEGLGLDEPVTDSGHPLTAELGPGLLGSLFDGIQRPLEVLKEKDGSFISRGSEAPPLSREATWNFLPAVEKGAVVHEGDLLGTVGETPAVEHRILVPPGRGGRVDHLQQGEVSVGDPVVALDCGEIITLSHRWPVRSHRPYRRKLDPETLFFTGQRVIDTLFPLAEGGAAMLPGGFGTGKTVVQHSLAKFAAADIIVFIGCGERGNEMAEVLSEFPELEDPYHGLPLSNRTVLIANTSNMPVAAREASIYTGVTIAEYFRDQGYRVALMADSISRWAEALREISSRMEELPGEEGYPTYMSSRIARFAERSGRVECHGGREGSVTMVCAVSPPGGDFSEPVTQASMRVAGSLWALDSSLAHRRHFPAVNPRTSYSLYRDDLERFFRRSVAESWPAHAGEALYLLQKEEELGDVVQLVGIDAIPDKERIVLSTGKMIRESFLAQSAFHEEDAFCSLEKQFLLLESILLLHRAFLDALEQGAPLETLLGLPARELIAGLKAVPNHDVTESVDEARSALKRMLDDAVQEARQAAGAGEDGE